MLTKCASCWPTCAFFPPSSAGVEDHLEMMGPSQLPTLSTPALVVSGKAKYMTTAASAAMPRMDRNTLRYVIVIHEIWISECCFLGGGKPRTFRSSWGEQRVPQLLEG